MNKFITNHTKLKHFSARTWVAFSSCCGSVARLVSWFAVKVCRWAVVSRRFVVACLHWFISKEASFSKKGDNDRSHEIGQIERIAWKRHKSIVGSLKSLRKMCLEGISQIENALDRDRREAQKSLKSSREHFAEKLGVIEHVVRTMGSQIEDIREYLGKNTDEINRWQEGYDWRLLKNHLSGIFRSLDNVEDTLKGLRKKNASEDVIRPFDFLRESFELNLEEEGVFPFSPEIESSPDSQRTDIQASVPCENEAHVGKVAEVIKKGYEIELDADRTRVVRKAKIIVYKLDKTRSSL